MRSSGVLFRVPMWSREGCGKLRAPRMTELRRARSLDCSDAPGGAELVRERFVSLPMPVKSPGYDSDR